MLLNSCYSSDEYEDLPGVEQDGELMRAMLLPAGYSVSWTEGFFLDFVPDQNREELFEHSGGSEKIRPAVA